MKIIVRLKAFVDIHQRVCSCWEDWPSLSPLGCSAQMPMGPVESLGLTGRVRGRDVVPPICVHNTLLAIVLRHRSPTFLRQWYRIGISPSSRRLVRVLEPTSEMRQLVKRKGKRWKDIHRSQSMSAFSLGVSWNAFAEQELGTTCQDRFGNERQYLSMVDSPPLLASVAIALPRSTLLVQRWMEHASSSFAHTRQNPPHHAFSSKHSSDEVQLDQEQ